MPKKQQSTMDLVDFPVHLTPSFAKKLTTGEPVLFSKSRLAKKGDFPLKLTPQHVQMLEKAMLKGKGKKVALCKEEIEGSGLWNWLKKAGKTAKKVAKAGAKIYREELRDKVGDKVREGLVKGLDWSTDALAANPFTAKFGVPLNVIEEKYGPKVVDYLGQKAGLFSEEQAAAAKERMGRGFAVGGGFAYGGGYPIMRPAVMPPSHVPGGMGFAYGGQGVSDCFGPPIISLDYLPVLHPQYNAGVYRGYGEYGAESKPFLSDVGK